MTLTGYGTLGFGRWSQSKRHSLVMVPVGRLRRCAKSGIVADDVITHVAGPPLITFSTLASPSTLAMSIPTVDRPVTVRGATREAMASVNGVP
jgi:hypothetical protein